jgi:hypothetical protein
MSKDSTTEVSYARLGAERKNPGNVECFLFPGGFSLFFQDCHAPNKGHNRTETIMQFACEVKFVARTQSYTVYKCQV